MSISQKAKGRKIVRHGYLMIGCIAAGLLVGLEGWWTQLQAQSSAPVGTVIVEGMTVPDIGPLPTVVPIPATNLNYTAKVDLGKQLYFDGRLAKDGAVSCAFCHNPFTGFADPRQTSIGVGGGVGGRQAPTVYNTGFIPLQFWDGRAGSLEEQAIGPIHNPVEMAETHENVAKKLSKIKGYQQQFRTVFGTDVNLQGIAEAIAAYERTVVSTNSPFDKYVMGDSKAMDEPADGPVQRQGALHPLSQRAELHRQSISQPGCPASRSAEGRFRTLRRHTYGA
jgi:cytochrome c peroxidase